MKTKKIAIVTPYGAEPRLDNYAEFALAQSLVERGYDVRFYTYRSQAALYERDVTYKTVSVIRCRERWGFAPGLFLHLLKFRPAVVLAFHPRSFLSFSAYVASRTVGAKYIAEIVGLLHDPFIVRDVDDPINTLRTPPRLAINLRTYVRAVLREGLKSAWHNYIFHMPVAHADSIVAINKDEQTYIRDIYNRESELIYWAAPTGENYAEQKPAVTVPDNFLFFIGQIKRRKGWDTALDALRALMDQGIPKELVFVSPQKDLREPIAHAQVIGVREQVTFLTAIKNEERNWLYAHATYVLIPSTYEGFGLPVFEAFLARRPICASDIPVFLEFLDNRKNAMIFRVGDGRDLARAIIELDTDPELQKTLIEHGEKTAKSFSRERMVEEFLRLIG